jgi:hypothetical protein
MLLMPFRSDNDARGHHRPVVLTAPAHRVVSAAATLAAGMVALVAAAPPAESIAATGAEAAAVELSSLEPVRAVNGSGPVELDSSNGSDASGDGRPMSIQGATFATGLGVAADSDVVYSLNGEYAAFTSWIGIDDEVGRRGSAVFAVEVDGVRRYTSPRIRGTHTARQISVDLTGARTLRLLVQNSGDGARYDNAAWAQARLTPADGTSTPSPSATTAAATTSPTSTTTSGTPSPAPSSYPDAATTGARGTLTARSGDITVTTDGAVIENIDLQGTIRVQARNVTIRNVKVTSSDYWPIFVEGTGATVEDSTIVGAGSSQASIGDAGGSNVFRRLNLFGGADGIKIANNSTLADSFIHDLARGEGLHNDAVEMSGTVGIRILHNTILNSNSQTSAIFIGGNSSPTRDVVVDSNLVAGGGYTIYGPKGDAGVGPSSNVKVTNNRFSTRYFSRSGSYGPLAYWEDGSGNAWSGNVWFDGPNAGSPVG